MSSHIKDWDAQQVVEWLNGVYKDNPKRAAKLGAVIEENGFTGKELLECETVEELAEALETNRLLTKSLFKEMQIFKGKLVDDVVDEAAKSSADLSTNGITLKTEQDLDALIEIFRDLFGIKSDDDEKEQMDAEDDDSTKSYREMIKDVAKDFKDFVKNMVGIRLKKSVTEEIIDICYDYRALLKDTAKGFGEYSSEISDLEQLMHQISYTFSLPSMVITKINGMDAKNKQTAITKLRKQTTEQLRSSTKKFSDKLHSIDEVHIPELDKLSDAWTDLSKRIMQLLKMLKTSGDEQKQTQKQLSFIERQMQRMQHAAEWTAGFCLKMVAMPIVVVVGVASSTAVCTTAALGGVALATAGTPLGAIVGGAAIVGAAVTAAGSGAAIGRAARKMIDKGDELMSHARYKAKQLALDQQQFERTEKNITQIMMMQTALRRMDKIAAFFSGMIDTETMNFRKIQDNDPHKQLMEGGFSESEVGIMLMNEVVLAKMAAFGKTLLRCTKHLNKSKENIALVEKTCAQEMNSFSVNILEPLADMLTAKTNDRRSN